MKSTVPRRAGLELAALILISVVAAAAPQDMTVEWKATLSDLEHRLPGLPAEGAARDAWRADAESLRSSIASTASSYAEGNVQLPQALPPQPSHTQLEQQLQALSTAVDQVIRQSPGSPFHLGTVQVTVSATAPTPSPVGDSIDQTGGTSPATALCPNSRIIGFCSEMANIGNEVHQGVEFEVRSTPLSRLTLNASYSFLNRAIVYDFGALPNVSAVNTSISILPVLPKNRVIGTATVRLPHQILGNVNERYESGLVVQDTTYSTASPLFLPRSESYATTDLGLIAPIRAGTSVQAGVKIFLIATTSIRWGIRK